MIEKVNKLMYEVTTAGLLRYIIILDNPPLPWFDLWRTVFVDHSTFRINRFLFVAEIFIRSHAVNVLTKSLGMQ